MSATKVGERIDEAGLADADQGVADAAIRRNSGDGGQQGGPAPDQRPDDDHALRENVTDSGPMKGAAIM